MSDIQTEREAALQAQYVARINRAMDFIEAHLTEELQLADVARAAGFSKYHFHRLFRGISGETLNYYIKRIRVEKAASQLLTNRLKPITEIAFDCGFNSSAAFSRAFKVVTGVSASDWREQKFDNSKIGKMKSKNSEPIRNNGKDVRFEIRHDVDMSSTPTWRIKMEKQTSAIEANIEVKDMPDFNAVYVRHVGPYQGDGELFGRLIGKLCGWAGPRGLLTPEAKMLMVYHDDPNLTDDEKLRVDVCLTTNGEVEVSGDIGQAVVPGGPFAVGHFEIEMEQYGDAWEAVMGKWLPQSGYEPDDRLCYEMCLNDPSAHPEGKAIVDICVPVRPM